MRHSSGGWATSVVPFGVSPVRRADASLWVACHRALYPLEYRCFERGVFLALGLQRTPGLGLACVALASARCLWHAAGPSHACAWRAFVLARSAALVLRARCLLPFARSIHAWSLLIEPSCDIRARGH